MTLKHYTNVNTKITVAKTQENPRCSQICEEGYFYSRRPKKSEVKKRGGGSETSYNIFFFSLRITLEKSEKKLSFTSSKPTSRGFTFITEDNPIAWIQEISAVRAAAMNKSFSELHEYIYPHMEQPVLEAVHKIHPFTGYEIEKAK